MNSAGEIDLSGPAFANAEGKGLPLRGYTPILSMPYLAGGAIDHEVLAAETDYLIGLGVPVVAFGYGCEPARLTDRERDQTLDTVVAATRKRVPVIAHVTALSTVAAVDRCLAAEAQGAEGIMIVPPPASEAGLRAFFDAVTAVGTCSFIAQGLGILREVSVDFLVELSYRPRVAAIKIETFDATDRIAQVRERGDPACALLGAGAHHTLSQLRAGGSGPMPGVGHAVEYFRLLELYLGGRESEAEALFSVLQPVLTFEFHSPDVFFYLQKEMLRRRGVFRNTVMREPAEIPAPGILREFDVLQARLDAHEVST